MRLTITPALLTALLLVLAGCGSASNDAANFPAPSAASAPEVLLNGSTIPATPSCDDVMGTGVTITDKGTLSRACKTSDGVTHTYGAGSQTCKDGRQLVWNDRGWGYVGSAFTVSSTGLPPKAETAACKG